MIRSSEALKGSHDRDVLHVVDVAEERPAPVAAAGPTPVVTDSAMAPASPGAVPPTSTAITSDAILSRCNRSKWKPDSGSILFRPGRDEPDTAAEEFRTLRSRLYQLREQHPLKTILITSALPGEGKSFVAANLALVLALQPRCRVLLVDADMRSSHLHSVLGASSVPGLAEYSLGEVEDELSLLQNGADENLFFLSAGRRVPGPTELIADSRLKAMFDRLQKLFDWVIVDSPAALPVSDTTLLANYCDGVLLVVRSNSTPYDLIRKARHKFREEQLIGVVLNGIDARPQPQNSYYQTREIA